MEFAFSSANADTRPKSVDGIASIHRSFAGNFVCPHLQRKFGKIEARSYMHWPLLFNDQNSNNRFHICRSPMNLQNRIHLFSEFSRECLAHDVIVGRPQHRNNSIESRKAASVIANKSKLIFPREKSHFRKIAIVFIGNLHLALSLRPSSSVSLPDSIWFYRLSIHMTAEYGILIFQYAY